MAIVPYITGTPEWHALRAKHVGASEVSALYGIQPDYAPSYYALWMVKAGLAEPPDVSGERIFWGSRLESLIAEVTAEAEGWTIRKGGYASDDLCPGLGASMDYEILGSPELEDEGYFGDGALECKAVDWLVHKKKWTDEEPPVPILLQLQTQCAARGFSWGCVGALISGNERRLYRYHARPALIAGIRERTKAFWASIREGRRPDPDGSDGATHILRQLYPEIQDDLIDLTGDNELPGLCADALRMQRERLDAKKAEETIKARITEKLSGHAKAMVDGFFVSMSVTPPNPGRTPKPGELIGTRKEVRKINVSESVMA